MTLGQVVLSSSLATATPLTPFSLEDTATANTEQPPDQTDGSKDAEKADESSQPKSQGGTQLSSPVQSLASAAATITASAANIATLEHELSLAQGLGASGNRATTYAALQSAISAAQAVLADTDANDAIVLSQAAALRAARKAVVKSAGSATLADGYYSSDVYLRHASRNQLSMGDAGFIRAASLYVYNEQAHGHVSFKQMNFQGLTGYLADMSRMTNVTLAPNGYPMSYQTVPSTLLSVFNVTDKYNGVNATDPLLRGKMYPQKMTLPIDASAAFTWVEVYVPVMTELAAGEQVARLDFPATTRQRIGFDLSALNSAITAAEAQGSAGVSAQDYAALQAAISAAKDIRTSADTCTQAEIDTQTVALRARLAAIAGNAPAANMGALPSLISQAQQKKAADYSADSIGLMQTALANATAATSSSLATQAEIDAASAALQTTLNFLAPMSAAAKQANTEATKPATKAELSALADRAAKAKPATYTKSSFAALTRALTQARAILNDPGATQRQVNDAYNALKRAYDGLVKRPSGTVSKDDMTDGRYSVRVDFWHSSADKPSMGNPALNKTALIDVKGDRMVMSVSTKQLRVGSIVTSLGTLVIGGRNARVIARNLPGGKPSAFSFTLPNKNTYHPVMINPQVEAMGNRAVPARLRISWDTLRRVSASTSLSSDTSVAESVAELSEDVTRTAVAPTGEAPEPVLGAPSEAGAATGDALARDVGSIRQGKALPWYGWVAIAGAVAGVAATGWVVFQKKVVVKRKDRYENGKV